MLYFVVFLNARIATKGNILLHALSSLPRSSTKPGFFFKPFVYIVLSLAILQKKKVDYGVVYANILRKCAVLKKWPKGFKGYFGYLNMFVCG